jgi:signal transduction histidine kinase
MPVDDANSLLRPHALDQLRHDLRTPLTTISGHAQLLGRAIRRAPSLPDEERGRMEEALATIEAEVLTVVSLVDGLGQRLTDGAPDSAG